MRVSDPFTPPDVALVLEGGGFRGMFTAGVPERFMSERLCFERAIGVSAGAAYGISARLAPARPLAFGRGDEPRGGCRFGKTLVSSV